MAYKQRPGVVLMDVCGSKLLVAQRSIWEDCGDKIQVMGMLGHICWAALEKDMPKERVAHLVASLTRKTQEEAEAQMDDFYRTLFERGFLIEVPDGEDGHDGA